MTDQPFSQRHETRRPSDGLIHDKLTHGLVFRLINIVDLVTELWNVEYKYKVVRGAYASVDFQIDWDASSVDDLIGALKWDEYCDACEALYRLIEKSGRTKERDRFSNELNALFGRQYFAWELRDGKIERVGTAAHEASIAEARALLRDDRFSGPDTQFQKAVEFYSRRPQPDSENCVKEAVGAAEGTARILLDDKNILLPDALEKIRKEKGMHPAFLEGLKKFYGYRGDADGVTHGSTTPEVRPQDAAFVLSLAASTIVYLARLYDLN